MISRLAWGGTGQEQGPQTALDRKHGLSRSPGAGKRPAGHQRLFEQFPFTNFALKSAGKQPEDDGSAHLEPNEGTGRMEF